MPMAFFPSFRNEFDTLYPQTLRARLAGFPLLADIGEPALRRMLAQATWFGLPGGTLLKREGENEAALFLVVTGCLGVFTGDEAGGRRLIAHVPAGETVGEMSLLTGGEHAAEIVALRDTELLRISAEGFEALASRHPRVMFNVMRALVRRIHDSSGEARAAARPKTFAIVPLQDGLEDEDVVHKLAATLTEMGSKAAVLDSAAAERSAEGFTAFEAAHDVVLYRGDGPDTAWTHLCIRQADRIFLMARADRPLPPRPMRTKERICGLPELLLLHAGYDTARMPEMFASQGSLFESHHHIREGRPDDIRRLARFIAGRAVGLVLGGGGARGFAHIGIAKALIEAQVPFDCLGGVSMGAIIAAGLAAEWSIDELTERMREAFVEDNPISDFTVPLIAIVRGKKVAKLLRANFGDRRIEALPRQFFCVSADLTNGHIHEHRMGYIWRALRASVALPGIMPPMTWRGHLLVDGGVMNNLPVDLMRERRIGPLIASDVVGEIDMSVHDSRYAERPVWRLLWQRMRGVPSIVSILMSSATVGSEAQRKLVREEADFLFEPPLPDLNPLDWRAFDRAIAEGYDHARAVIDKKGVPLTDAWSEGPALAVPER